MSFYDDFKSCLAPLPPPGDLADSLEELLDFLHQLHTAAEASGGVESTIGALIAAGAFVGIDETAVAALGAAAGYTVAAYIAACAACAVAAAGSKIWDLITASNDSYLQQQLTVAANDANVKPGTSMA